jgi:hypothetical protein
MTLIITTYLRRSLSKTNTIKLKLTSNLIVTSVRCQLLRDMMRQVRPVRNHRLKINPTTYKSPMAPRSAGTRLGFSLEIARPHMHIRRDSNSGSCFSHPKGAFALEMVIGDTAFFLLLMTKSAYDCPLRASSSRCWSIPFWQPSESEMADIWE